MSMHTVFLIQEDEESINELAKGLDSQKFKIVGCSKSGEEAIQMILDIIPSVVLTELTLPGIDGLELIERIVVSAPQIKIVVLSSISSNNIIKRAMQRGAAYYMIKPVNPNTLCARILDLLEDGDRSQNKTYIPRQGSLDEKISKIFISVGIPPHIKGYSYLREGVKLAIYQPAIINKITKQLYPQIGMKYETSPSKVERAIRHAIEVAWNRGRIDNINGLFGVRAYVASEKPTNGEFIALIADKMLLEGA